MLRAIRWKIIGMSAYCLKCNIRAFDLFILESMFGLESELYY